ncbi:MAG: hypothetical protein RL538_405 [Candidatus Parcubacteria bacterium]|jgi:hypothetical protein
MDTAPVVALPDIAFLPALPGADIVTLLFYLILGFYAIFTGILYYHWNAYSSDKKVTFATYVAYLAITIPLIMVMIGSSSVI